MECLIASDDKTSVNIRSISNPVSPVDLQRVQNPRGVVTDSSSEDRDPNGRSDQDQEPDRNPLNDEEMKRAKEYLDSLAGLKTNGLSIEVEPAGELRVFLIKDQTGHVVRRIVEWEMRALIGKDDNQAGQIFDRAI